MTYQAKLRELLSDDALYEAVLLLVQQELNHKQALIDELMLEYCPDSVTDEQWAEYRKHQQPVDKETLLNIVSALGSR